MRRIFIVGCGSAKLDHEAPARDLYTGSLFVAARRYVEALGDQWFVLSAKYGLVRPEHELKPYEQTLPKRGEYLRAWARSAAAGASAQSFWKDADHEIAYPERSKERRFVFLCGVEYAEPVAAVLESWGYECEQPLAGLQLGQRLQWLKRQHEEVARAS